MSKDLDTWVIKDNGYEIDFALDNLVIGSENNILYSNCFSRVKLGDQVISNNRFGSVFYAEDSDLLVLLENNGDVSYDDLKAKIEKTGIKYSEVIFDKDSENVVYAEDTISKDLWFCKDNSILEDALMDSEKKGLSHCTYYPYLNGTFSLDYLDTNDELCEFNSTCINGVVELDDKMVLLTGSYDMSYDVFKNLAKCDINCLVNPEKELSDVKVKVKR